MNISAILVVVQPGKLNPTLAELERLPNLEVHHIDNELINFTNTIAGGLAAIALARLTGFA